MLHIFCRLVLVVYTLATFMVESIVQHISGQFVVDDCLVAQGTFGVIWCREGNWCKAVHNPMSWKSMHAKRAQISTWVSTSFENFLQQVSQEFGMNICSTFSMLQPVKAFSFGRQLFFWSRGAMDGHRDSWQAHMFRGIFQLIYQQVSLLVSAKF